MTTSAREQRAWRFNAAGAKNRLQTQGGFSLGELLVTVLIVGLVTCLLATGATLATTQFMRSMAHSESFMLYSTLEQVLDNELSYTQTIYGSESSENTYAVDGFQSRHYIAVDGESGKVSTCYLMTVDSGGAAHPMSQAGSYGQLALCSENGKNINRLLGTAAYNYGLVARVGSLTFDSASRLFTVNLIIARSSGEAFEELVNETFSVRALNIIYLNGENISGGSTGTGEDEGNGTVDTDDLTTDDIQLGWRGPVNTEEASEASGATLVAISNNTKLNPETVITFTLPEMQTYPEDLTLKLFLLSGKNGKGSLRGINVVKFNGRTATVTLPSNANNGSLCMNFVINSTKIKASDITVSVSNPSAGKK